MVGVQSGMKHVSCWWKAQSESERLSMKNAPVAGSRSDKHQRAPQAKSGGGWSVLSRWLRPQGDEQRGWCNSSRQVIGPELKSFQMTLPAVYPSEQGLVFRNPAVRRPILAEGVRRQRPSGVHSPYPSSHLIVKSFFFQAAGWHPLVGCKINFVLTASILQNGMEKNKMNRIELN